MRPSFYITIPHETEVKKGSTWLTNADHEFFVYRTHWLIKERQTGVRGQVGEKVSLFASEPTKGRKWQGSTEAEMDLVHTEDTIRQALLEYEQKAGINTELGGEISALAIAKTTGKLKSLFEERLKSQSSFEESTVRTITVTQNVKFQWEFPIPDHSQAAWCCAAMYQQYAYDVYLAYIDYLFVRYDRPHFLNLRKVRYKFPQVVGSDHPNWIKVHQPLCSVLLWKLLPHAAKIIKEEHYEQELQDPYEMFVERLESRLSHSHKPTVATLYELSNHVFPHRWSKMVQKVVADADAASA